MSLTAGSHAGGNGITLWWRERGGICWILLSGSLTTQLPIGDTGLLVGTLPAGLALTTSDMNTRHALPAGNTVLVRYLANRQVRITNPLNAAGTAVTISVGTTVSIMLTVVLP